MKKIILAILALVFISCQFSKKEKTSLKVEHKGALKNFMMKGDISSKVGLSEFKGKTNFYALGAVENLKGEIQIFNSEPFITSVEKNKLKIDRTLNKNASLLVYASVEKWKSITVPKYISSYEQLEEYIEKTAAENGIDIEQPFPFLLEGLMDSIDWHVINWKDGDTIHTHQKHKTSGLYGTLEDKEVEMLGFYSKSHHAIFTHHTTNMHIHVKTIDDDLAGHVDGLYLGSGITLKLPDNL